MFSSSLSGHLPRYWRRGIGIGPGRRTWWWRSPVGGWRWWGTTKLSWAWALSCKFVAPDIYSWLFHLSMSCLVHILQSYEWCLLFIHSSPAEATLIITLHSASTQRQAREVKTTFGSVLTWPDRTEYGVWEGGLLSRHGEDSLRQPVFVLTSIHCRYLGGNGERRLTFP